MNITRLAAAELSLLSRLSVDAIPHSRVVSRQSVIQLIQCKAEQQKPQLEIYKLSSFCTPEETSFAALAAFLVWAADSCEITLYSSVTIGDDFTNIRSVEVDRTDGTQVTLITEIDQFVVGVDRCELTNNKIYRRLQN